MSGEEWTVATLKEHYDQRLKDIETLHSDRVAALRDLIQAALDAAKEAVLKAEGASDRRFDGVNEFRKSLEDYEQVLYPRKEAEGRISGVESRVTALESKSTGEAGQRLGVRSGYGLALGVVAVVCTILGIFVTLLVKGTV